MSVWKDTLLCWRSLSQPKNLKTRPSVTSLQFLLKKLLTNHLEDLDKEDPSSTTTEEMAAVEMMEEALETVVTLIIEGEEGIVRQTTKKMNPLPLENPQDLKDVMSESNPMPKIISQKIRSKQILMRNNPKETSSEEEIV